MNVGDRMMSGRQIVTVFATEPDMNGEIVVRNEGGYYVPIRPEALVAMPETVIVDTPSGRYEIEVPTDGNTETRATLLDPAPTR